MDTDPKDIINGKVIYKIDDFFRDFREFTDHLKGGKEENTEEDKRRNFKKLFMFVLLSALGKKSKEMSEVLYFPEDKIIEGKELFAKEIRLLEVIWQTMYLEIMKEHVVISDSLILKILNNTIQAFLKSSFPEEYTHEHTI